MPVSEAVRRPVRKDPAFLEPKHLGPRVGRTAGHSFPVSAGYALVPRRRLADRGADAGPAQKKRARLFTEPEQLGWAPPPDGPPKSGRPAAAGGSSTCAPGCIAWERSLPCRIPGLVVAPASAVFREPAPRRRRRDERSPALRETAPLACRPGGVAGRSARAPAGPAAALRERRTGGRRRRGAVAEGARTRPRSAGPSAARPRRCSRLRARRRFSRPTAGRSRTFGARAPPPDTSRPRFGTWYAGTRNRPWPTKIVDSGETCPAWCPLSGRRCRGRLSIIHRGWDALSEPLVATECVAGCLEYLAGAGPGTPPAADTWTYPLW